MANKPVVGIIECPHCGKSNMVGWNGNCKFPCFYCGKTFTVKRTRLHHTTPIITPEEYQQLAEEFIGARPVENKEDETNGKNS